MIDNIEKIKIIVKEIQNLFYAKKYGLIIQETKKAIKKYPNISIFYNMMGLALSKLGKFNDAILVLKKGLSINQNDLAIINNLANAYKNVFNYEEAEKLYKISITKKKDYFNAYVNYGNLKRDLNNFTEAIAQYKNALNYNKKIPDIYYSLSMAYQALGDFKEAEEYAKKTIEINNKYTKADLLISRSRKYNTNDDHLAKMKEKLLKENLNNSEKVDLYFALAKAHEDFGEIEKSFEYLREGNKLQRNNINFDLNFEKKSFDDLKNFFSKVDFNKYKNISNDSRNIIFILGMPRSGTTLTEQIVSAHSKVYGSGELPYLTKITNEKFYENKTLSENKINKIINNEKQISQIAEEYYSYLKGYEISSKFLTDKAPLNFLWIGFIKIFFPNSKIIHCKRNAKDNCVSLYKNVFEGGINFCYTEDELGEYYKLYENLMVFWESKLPGAFLNIEYEKLVTEPKNEIKKILEYCELSWEENCLNFSDNKTPIKTASVGQARNRIYSSSLNSFTKYEVFLKDLFKLL